MRFIWNKKLIKDFPIKLLLRRRTAPIAKINEISVEVKAICNVVHTDTVKTAYTKHLESLKV